MQLSGVSDQALAKRVHDYSLNDVEADWAAGATAGTTAAASEEPAAIAAATLLACGNAIKSTPALLGLSKSPTDVAGVIASFAQSLQTTPMLPSANLIVSSNRPRCPCPPTSTCFSQKSRGERLSPLGEGAHTPLGLHLSPRHYPAL